MLTAKQYQNLIDLGFTEHSSTEVSYDFVDYIISVETLFDSYKGTIYKVRMKTGEENPIVNFDCPNFTGFKQLFKIFEKQYESKFTTIEL
jgi:hypothetical protein